KRDAQTEYAAAHQQRRQLVRYGVLRTLRTGWDISRVHDRYATDGGRSLRPGLEGIDDRREVRLARARVDQCRIDRAVGRRIERYARLPSEGGGGRHVEQRRGQTVGKAGVGVELHLVGDVVGAVRKERVACLRRADGGSGIVPLQLIHDGRRNWACSTPRRRGSGVAHAGIEAVHEAEAVAQRTREVAGGEVPVVGEERPVVVEVAVLEEATARGADGEAAGGAPLEYGIQRRVARVVESRLV